MHVKKTNTIVNREYKDRLFTFIFGSEDNRSWTLSLYNAINGSHYTDPSLIQFNTLKDVLYMKMKNDTSFLISDILSVYEHQSTLNPNMPLRFLQYISQLYSGYISENRLNKYNSTLIMLPTPRLVVFYNGISETDDKVILRLSDSFSAENRADADVEVRVQMLNVNYGRNLKLMEECAPLREYAWLIDKIRTYHKTYDIIEATDHAIDDIPDDFEIRGFLVTHRKEVQGMLDTEYNEAEVMELFREEVAAEKKRAEDAEAKLEETKVMLDKALEEIAQLKAAK